ncbi:MAG TPA: 5'-3' exonuclease [Micromonosporaceae bacterium]
MSRPLLLVDSASLYFRAFFGVPESAATAKNGMPVNAVRGFLEMLSTLIRGRGPDRLVCALDEDWRPAWRVALISSYKTHRLAGIGSGGVDEEIVPDALSAQVPVIFELLDAFGIAAVGAPGYEADDIIGTLATREPGPVEVATGDRDLFQLIDDERGVRVLYCGRGVSKLEVFDNATLEAKYGVPASGYADFAALRGDPSDGLPGVTGVGEKTAARLVARYGSVDAIMAALADPDAGFAPGVRTKLAAATDYLKVAPEVVRVVRDVALPPVDTALPRVPRDPDRLIELAETWGVPGAVRRLVEVTSE